MRTFLLNFGMMLFSATYLINRMPTRVIDNATPLERLLHTPPNYSMLRVFGCACWPHLRAYNKTKLSFRSKECVFLGYSSLHKGYKCLDRESGRVYVSRDVIFDEHVFPFHRDSNQSSSTNSHSCETHLDNNSVILSNDPLRAPLPANPLHADMTETLSSGFPPSSTEQLHATLIGGPDLVPKVPTSSTCQQEEIPCASSLPPTTSELPLFLLQWTLLYMHLFQLLLLHWTMYIYLWRLTQLWDLLIHMALD
jgi:hypothetical protein